MKIGQFPKHHIRAERLFIYSSNIPQPNKLTNNPTEYNQNKRRFYLLNRNGLTAMTNFGSSRIRPHRPHMHTPQRSSWNVFIVSVMKLVTATVRHPSVRSTNKWQTILLFRIRIILNVSLHMPHTNYLKLYLISAWKEHEKQIGRSSDPVTDGDERLNNSLITKWTSTNNCRLFAFHPIHMQLTWMAETLCVSTPLLRAFAWTTNKNPIEFIPNESQKLEKWDCLLSTFAFLLSCLFP